MTHLPWHSENHLKYLKKRVVLTSNRRTKGESIRNGEFMKGNSININKMQ